MAVDRSLEGYSPRGRKELDTTEHMLDVALQVNGITQYVDFPDRLLSTSLMFSRFLPVAVSLRHSISLLKIVHRVDGAHLLVSELRGIRVASDTQFILLRRTPP